MTEAKQTKRTRRQKSRAFDEALGAKVRALRVGAGMNQTALAAHLAISYQQMQKYETGRDRISVHALSQIAAALGSPIAVFLEDTPVLSGSIPVMREVMKAVAVLQAIEHPALRRRLLELIAELAKADAGRAEKP